MPREFMKKPDQDGKCIQFGDIAAAFFRRLRGNDKGQVYFGFKRHGVGPTVHFPVLSDGSILKTSDDSNIYPNEEVMMVPTKELGIEQLVWT